MYHQRTWQPDEQYTAHWHPPQKFNRERGKVALHVYGLEISSDIPLYWKRASTHLFTLLASAKRSCVSSQRPWSFLDPSQGYLGARTAWSLRFPPHPACQILAARKPSSPDPMPPLHHPVEPQSRLDQDPKILLRTWDYRMWFGIMAIIWHIAALECSLTVIMVCFE